MNEISVIILNYHQSLLTLTCVKKLLKNRKATFEIIVIDNSCSEKEALVLRKIKDVRVTVIIAEKNLGCAAGYNLGIQKAKGKYIFILNNDTESTDLHALYKMKSFMDVHKDVAVIQPKIKSMTKPSYFEYAGAAGGFIDLLGYPFCRGRIFKSMEKDTGQFNTNTEISWASTCAFFGRRNVLIKVGLFDPIYFAYAEEVDISLKIWGSGYRILSFSDTEIFHKGEASWKKIRGKKTYLIHRNHLILYFKCLPLRDVILFLPLRLSFEFLSMINYIMNKSNLHIFPVLLANLHIIFLFPKILKRRVVFFQKYKENIVPIYRHSIVIDYFLLKRTQFRMLKQKYFIK